MTWHPYWHMSVNRGVKKMIGNKMSLVRFKRVNVLFEPIGLFTFFFQKFIFWFFMPRSICLDQLKLVNPIMCSHRLFDSYYSFRHFFSSENDIFSKNKA